VCVCVRERQSGGLGTYTKESAEVLHMGGGGGGGLTPRAYGKKLGGGGGLTPSAFANEPGRGKFNPSAFADELGVENKYVPKRPPLRKKGLPPQLVAMQC
jgi:hypothetical protein